MNIQLITADLALLLCPVALSAATPKQSTLRVVASTQQISQPQGLWQVSPTLFYTTSNQTILSVTTGGEVAVLFVAPSGYNIGYVPVTAPNNRSYSAYGSEETSYQISLKASPNSVETYPATTVGGGFIQGLPDGTLFGVGSYFSTGAFYLASGAEDGVVTPLYQFPSYQVPMSPIYGSDGNYYGVSWAYEGSLAGSSYVFQVTPAGAFTKIADLPNESFTTGNPGSFFQADDGNFYGTTTGANPAGTGIGTLYQVTPSGQYALIYSFGKGAGSTPGKTLQGSDGNFYGVTKGSAGPTSYGEIFQLTKTGQYTALYQTNSKSGFCPCWIMQGSDGQLWGTTDAGGAGGGGTIFALDAGLPKPAPRALSFSPSVGNAGTTKVRIWGYNLLAASVQFNGVAATEVHNAGPNYAWATVPAGATTGPITVTTPGGASTTTAPFTVK